MEIAVDSESHYTDEVNHFDCSDDDIARFDVFDLWTPSVDTSSWPEYLRGYRKPQDKTKSAQVKRVLKSLCLLKMILPENPLPMMHSQRVHNEN